MKVAIVHNLYPPYARGGAEQVVVNEVKGLVQAGHSVVVITLGSVFEVEKMENITIYRLAPKNIFSYFDIHKHSYFLRLFWHVIDIWNFDSARTLKEVLQQEKPDMVHTHNCMGIGFLLPRVIQKLKIFHVHTVHDVQLVEPSGIILKQKEHSWRYRGGMTRMYVFIMRNLFRSPNVVTSPSQFLLEFHKRWHFFCGSKHVLLHNPVIFDMFDVTKKDDFVFRFLYLGQIEAHKGILFLTKTFCEFVKKSAFPCELHIVGNGSKLQELQHMIRVEKSVYIHGQVDHSQIVDVFQNVDITVVPSLCYENSPMVIFESFLYNTPVLASIEGIENLIKDGKNGYTFISGDQNSLYEKLQWCVEHKNEVREMGKVARDQIKTFSIDEYVDQLLNLYYQKDV